MCSRHRTIATINDLNTQLEVGAGGFQGSTNPAYVYTVIDAGPNAASHDDVRVLTNSLAYVMSQGSAFLLDADDTTSFDFPANYVVLNFETPPSLATSAALFRTVGQIDDELFSTDTSGYTQVRMRVSLTAIRCARRPVHRRLCCGRCCVRSGVHADRAGSAGALPGRGCLSRQRLVHGYASARNTSLESRHRVIGRWGVSARFICGSLYKCSGGSERAARGVVTRSCPRSHAC